MADLHSLAVTASVAAASSLLTLAAAAYLAPLWQSRNDNRGVNNSSSLSRQRLAAKTPEPPTSAPASATAVFSPVNKQKRPDAFDPRPRDTYLCWDDYFMAVAFLSAERSKDPNKQVGACIVNDENIILSIGYNGFPRGCADSALPWAKRAKSDSILDTKYPYVVHAEANALLNKNQAHVTGARIYVTLFPCNECAKLLIQAGIKEVIFHEAKLEPTGQRPATMERAAAADAAADCLAEAGGVAGSSHCRSCCCNGGSSSESGGDGSGSQGHNVATPATPTPDDVEFCLRQPQQPGQSAMPSRQQQQKKKFGVGASEDVDASYAASQRLLMLAGVTLRQHTLQRSIRLGPG